MNTINLKKTAGAVTELTENEIMQICGGSKLSLDAFRLIGMAFEVVNQAAMVGAPAGNTYRHSG